jgi:tetratricopeptide (TPR) repeat protein
VELARVYLSRGALKEATHELQPALTNNYTMRAALLITAQIAQRNGQPETAAQLAHRTASLPHAFDWPDALLREVQSLRTDRARLADQANALIQQQRASEAEATLAKLLNAVPDDAEGLLLLGRLRYVQRRCPEAEATLRRHLAVQTNSLNGLVQLGLSLLCQQKWTNAAEVLEHAIALKPDFAQAHNNLGLARSRLGDSAGAIRAYRDALRCNPGDINAHMSLAEELANAGQMEEAKKHVEQAAALNPTDSRIRAAREQLGVKP